MTSTIACPGCGYAVPPLEPRPFRCPRAGADDTDHVLARHVEGATPAPFFDDEPQPFVRFRTFTHAWHTAMRIGMSDEEFVAIVRDLDARVGGLKVTPFTLRDGLWCKDETHNPGGSHKIRHLFGLMVWLRVAERIDPSIATQRLAIASCGNAARAAAIVARAADRELDVYVPDDASIELPNVTRCARIEGVDGDPSYLRFRDAVDHGALPFTCQGNENGLVIEGGQTLGWEIASSGVVLDALFIQVGGGALASAVIAGLEEAHALGVIPHMPRIHAVQTLASPLLRAWERVQQHGLDVQHRSRYMWPWETQPRSIATGILDDETYDWVAIVRGMLATGGWPVVVTEDQLREAQRIAGPHVSATGAAGIAGVLAARPRDEAVGVILSGAAFGVRRHGRRF